MIDSHRPITIIQGREATSVMPRSISHTISNSPSAPQFLLGQHSPLSDSHREMELNGAVLAEMKLKPHEAELIEVLLSGDVPREMRALLQETTAQIMAAVRLRREGAR